MSKISELSNGGALLSTDDLIVVRSGGNVRAQLSSLNGIAIGSSTPAAGSFTTLTASGSATLNGGVTIDPADGVADDAYALTVRNNEATDGRNYGLWVRAGSNSSDESFSVRNHDNSATYFKVRGDGNVGIGNSNPQRLLSIKGTSSGSMEIDGSATSNSQIAFKQGGTDKAYLTYWDSSDTLALTDGSANGLHFSPSSGNVGIGTDSPTFNTGSGLEIQRAGPATLRIEDTGSGGKPFEIYVDDAEGYVLDGRGSGMPMIFKVINTERMRLDTSGTLILSGNGGSTTNSLDIAYNGTSGQASINADSNGGSTFLTFGTSLSGSLNEAMRINSSGNVGLGGQTNPQAKLDIKGDTSSYAGMSKIYLTDTSSNAARRNWAIGNGGSAYGNFTIGVSNAADGDPMAAGTHTTPFIIDNSSNVYMNATTTPSASQSGFMFSTDQLFTATTSTALNFQIRLYNGNGLVGSITTSGSATAFNTSSDQRLKDNIQDAEDAGELIDAIQVRQFDWKVDGSHQRFGMVAQELTTVAPEAVSTPEDPDEMMGVDYSKLVPMLIKEIQSLRARVQQLEK